MTNAQFAYIALGSNIGDRADYLARALRELKKLDINLKVSSLYETVPLGPSKRKFLNQVAQLQTKLAPAKLLPKLQQIEKKLGRKKRQKWDPREIDLDLLFHGNRIIWQLGLKIPHPELAHRRFVLAPLVELSPNLRHPILGITTKTLLQYAPNLTIKKWKK